MIWTLEQLHESCLLKVVIRGEGLREPFLSHNSEGDAVRQTPIFIGAVAVQFPSRRP